MNETRGSRRTKSFLRGLIYDCRKRGALDCTIRDLSDDGARIAFSATVALPEVIELDIPQRELRRQARVVWRRNDEVGLSFVEIDGAVEHAAPATAAEIRARIGALEAEIATLRARLASLDEDDAPADGEAAV
ncbi:MAG TPA: PilZ domain-containing protein [Xanthobacteraceae bacterium]|nr:PilZ domain-containing protein [Xanthobacteraceae bacterium]